MSVIRSRRTLVGLTAGLIVLTSCGGDDAQLLGVVRTPALQVADVTLPDATTGADLQMKAAEDTVLLVYFGYTSCPDVCPTTLTDIRVALGDLDDSTRDRVRVAMVTVDPERDTDEVLDGYVRSFFPDGHAVRTEDTEVLEAAKSTFGVSAQIEEHLPGESYDVSHTAVTYVVDDRGEVVVEWPFGTESEAMTSDIEFLLDLTKEQS